MILFGRASAKRQRSRAFRYNLIAAAKRNHYKDFRYNHLRGINL